MDKLSSTLSHSITRLLGLADDTHLNRIERSSHITSDCTKQKRLSYQDEPLQTSTDVARSSSLPIEAHQESPIYPWMQIHHKSRKDKEGKSKMNFDCILVKFHAVVSPPC